jgi:predicted nucleotidyltransferase
MLTTLFGSEARVKVLALFMLHPASEFYLREIAHRTGLPVRAVERTVKALTEVGLLRREKRANSVYFSVNRDVPILPELKAMFLKTVGLGDRLRDALAGTTDVEIAFLFGSYAKGLEDPTSDVDVFLVGTASPRKLTPILTALEEETGREINATTFTPEELRDRVKTGDHFVRSVLASPKVYLIGDEDALDRIVR